MQLAYWSKLDDSSRAKILARCESVNDDYTKGIVSKIVDNVRISGDDALYAYAKEFDKTILSSLIVSQNEYTQAQLLDEKYQLAIKNSYDNIFHYHSVSSPTEFEYNRNGIKLGKIYRPIEKVGLYIPGGTASLVSTLMMLAIPAKIAGCPVCILATPPRHDGTIDPAILFAAKYCGIDTIYKMGGAQAIAALAYGTETVPKVHKIFGPGNKYVTEAKLQVSTSGANVAIDMPAGPSEVLVIGDSRANPQFIASDLLAQAEHDAEAQVIFVTTSEDLAEKVLVELEQQQMSLSRKTIIEKSLLKSAIIISESLDECFAISNAYAPEHLILHIHDVEENSEKYLAKVINAGSVFVGQWSPESAGDYASGTNHVLPTYGYANMYSGLDVISFMKAISFQSLSMDGLKHIGKTIEDLATIEGLDAHKMAVTHRLNYLKEQI